MALATLSVDLVAHLAKFEGDMGKAARATEKASQQIVASLGVVKVFMGGLAAGISVTAIVDMSKAVINGVDALNDLKDATGSSIENISALEDVAARTGTSFDTVQSSLIKFNSALNAAKPGSEQEAAFKALNLSVKELKELDPAEALLKTATALSGFADDGNKARLTQELFGKSLKEVAPFLNDLAEAGQLNATVTTEQAKQAEFFNKQLFELQKNSLDVARAIVGDVVPALNKLAIELVAIKKTSTGFWDGFFTQASQNPWKSASENAAKYRDELKDLEVDRDRFVRGGNDTTSIDTAIATMKRRLAYFREVELQTTEFSPGDQSSAEEARLGLRKGSVGDVVVAPKAKADKQQAEQLTRDQQALAHYVKTLDGALTTTQKLTEEQKALDFLKGLGTTGEIPQVRELVLAIAQKTDALQAEAEAYKAIDAARRTSDQYIAGLEKETAAMEETNKKMAEHVQEIGKTTVELGALTLARMDTAIAAAEQARAQLNLQNSSEAEIAAMERKIELLKEQRNITSQGQVAQASSDSRAEQAKASTDFANTLQTDLKGAFSAAFRDTSGEPLQAFGDAIANVLYSRAATALTETLVTSLLGASGGSGAGGGSLLASLFSFDGGGFTGAGSRSGGLDGKGGFMAMLHPQETVVDHTRGQSAGQAVTVVQNFTIGDVASIGMLRAAVAGSERRIAAAMGRSMSYGGALA